MISIIYFSSTGNVKYLAGRLLTHLGMDRARLIPLEFTDPSQLESSEHLLIMFSIHAFNPPRTVKRFVKKIPEGLYKSVSLISVGAAEIWMNTAASLGLRSILQKKGYTILLDKQMAMPLNIVKSLPEDLIKKQIVAAEKIISESAEAILSRKSIIPEISVKSKIIHLLGKVESPAARFFGLELHADKACTSCGICVKNCPEKNIIFNKNNLPKFGFSCLMCMRCIYNCPEKAISPRISKFIPIKEGFNVDYEAQL